jgi:hypothetical protein
VLSVILRKTLGLKTWFRSLNVKRLRNTSIVTARGEALLVRILQQGFDRSLVLRNAVGYQSRPIIACSSSSSAATSKRRFGAPASAKRGSALLRTSL